MSYCALVAPPAVDPQGTDADLITRSLRDRQHFTGIFDRHFEAIYAYIARRLGQSLAEDLASEVFLRAFIARDAFRLDSASARPWLYGIATNLIRNHHRAEQRRLAAITRLGAELRSPQTDPAEEVEIGAELRRVSEAVARLSPDRQDVLLLHAWAQLTREEISDCLGIPTGTVATRLMRARSQLRRELDVMESPTRAPRDGLRAVARKAWFH